MQITLKELDQRGAALVKLLESPFDISIAWRMKALAKQIVDNLADMAEYRQKLFKKLGQLDELGRYKVPNNLIPELDATWDKFLETEITLLDEKLTIEEVKKYAKVHAVDLCRADIIITP